MFGLPTKTIVIAAVVLSVIAAFGLYSRWIYKAGVTSEQRRQVETSLNRNADRNKDDEEIRNLDLDGLCREYGASRWVPALNKCE